jgi:formylglycine-generating enzyme
MKKVTALLILLLCTCILPLAVQAQGQFDAFKNNIVAIKASFDNGDEENGFGFITGEKNGRLYLATAAHVVRGVDMSKTPKTIKVQFYNDIRWVTATFLTHWDKEDLALLEIGQPANLKWLNACTNFAAAVNQKVRFIGLYDDEPNWVDPGIDGNIFKQDDLQYHFAIGTIRPGTSGAPLISEKGIVGMIIEDSGTISRALKIAKIQSLFNKGNQYAYFSLQAKEIVPAPKEVKKPDTKTAGPELKNDGFELIQIKGGTFKMGCTSEQGSDCLEDQIPAHTVKLSDFYLAKYEVTQAQWRAIMGNNPSNNAKCDECPVEQVSWDDIQLFLRKLNLKTGKKYRLPTEAEWEFAARGGMLSKNYKYAGSNNRSEVAWWSENASNQTHPKGAKKANELGLFDMNGNVWEWCQDWYAGYAANDQTDPKGPAKGKERVGRGGSWTDDIRGLNVSFRGFSEAKYKDPYLGFRLAL